MTSTPGTLRPSEPFADASAKPLAAREAGTRSPVLAPTTPSPALAPPPPGGALHGYDDLARRVFKALNTWLMVPAHRAGLGEWIGSPIGGYLLLLRVRGRKSGVIREVPLTYDLADGAVWLIAGFGPDTAWYRNLLANPDVELVLPGRRVRGTATENADPAVRARILPAFVRHAGAPALLSGLTPWRASDAQILRSLDYVPLIRVDTEPPVVPGPDDPGGRAWVWRQAVLLAAALLALRGVRRLVRAAVS
jgi:deazaflavin-dependent oxidoreductase (nitroreductase family)